MAGRSSTSRPTPGPAGPRSAISAWSGSAAGPPGPSSTWPCGPGRCGSSIADHSPGIGFRPDGSLTVATNDGRTGPDGRGRRPARRPPPRVRAARRRRRPDVNPAIRGDLLGGLWCRRDAVVEPGSVLGGPARRTLEATGRYRWLPGRQVVDVDRADRRRRRPWSTTSAAPPPGSLVLLCIGDRLSGLGGRVGRRPGRRPAPPVPAADDADRPRHRAAGHRRGRRRLHALLPRLRPPRSGRPPDAGAPRPPSGACSCCWCSGPAGG